MSVIGLHVYARDEVVRFMSDLTLPFTNNGLGRNLRMLKVQL